MGVFSRVRNWFSRNFGGSDSSSRSVRRARSVSNYGGGGSRYRSYYDDDRDRRRQTLIEQRDRIESQRAEQKRKQNATTNALSKIIDARSAGVKFRDESTRQTARGADALLERIAEKSKNAPEDPKVRAARESRERATRSLKTIDNKARNLEKSLNRTVDKVEKKNAAERKAYHEATGNKYNPRVGTAEERKLARQRIKSGEYQADPDVKMHDIKKHPIALSASRGALSGVTSGGSELLFKFAPMNERNRAAEEAYQQNKNRPAEIAGDIAGTLVTFGITGAPSAELLGRGARKLAPNLTARAVEKATTKVAANKLIMRAAEKEAVKRFGVEGATKEAIMQIARRRAGTVVSELAKDAAINATVGRIGDFNRAYHDNRNDGQMNWGGFGRDMATNAALNTLLGGVTSFVPAARVARNLPADDALNALVHNADETAEAAVKSADNAVRPPDYKVSLNRKRNTSVRMPEVRPQNVDEAVERAAVDTVERNADNAVRTIDDIDLTKPISEEDRVILTERRNALDAERNRIEAINGKPTPESEAMGAEVGRIDRALARPADEGAVFRTVDDGVRAPEAEQISLDEAVRAPEFDENGFPYEDAETARRINSAAKAEPPTLRAESPAKKPAKAEPPKKLAEAPKTVEDVSAFKAVDEPMPSTNPKLTAENEAKAELRDEAKRMAEAEPRVDADEGLTIHEATGTASDALPEGVRKARSAYENVNGEKIEGGMRTQWEEAWNASKEYSESHATGARRRKSKVGVTELNAMDSEAERELRKRLSDKGLLDYDTIRTEELYDKIAKQMRDDPDRWVKEMIDINEGGALDFRATPEWQARVQYIMATVDPSTDMASEIAYTEAFKLAKDISSKGGQALNLRRNFVHLTEMGKRDSALDDLIDMLLGSRGFVSKHPDLNKLGRFDKRNYVRAFLMKNPKIMEGVERLVKAGDPDAVSEAYTELLIDLNKENPKTLFDVVQEIRYLNMLGNPKTHIRNIFGSAFFAPIRQISNALRGSLEGYYMKKSGLNITRHGGLSMEAIADTWRKEPKTEGGKKALEAFNKLKTDVLGGMKYDQQTYKGRGRTVVGKGLDAVADFNSSWLTKEDNFFRERAFKENYIKSYNAYKSRGIPITPKLERQIEAEAIEEARIATFNEYNRFADWLTKITRNANNAEASLGARWGGRVVNAVMPFTKVPANLMKQSINYSPLGIAKGFANIDTAIKRGDAALLNRGIDELASGTTGTGIFALGMLLGLTTDRFTTNVGKDDAGAKFKKQQGVQNYSVTVGEGDKRYSVTLDWLVPTSATFFAGVETANQCKKSGFNPLDIMGDWSTVMSRLAEPVVDSSMLSGLHGMLETMRGNYGDDDKLGAPGILVRETAQSYINSLIPTILGQTARTAYKTDKQLPQAGDWTYFWNQAKLKTGLAGDNFVTRKLGIEPLGADTDAYGNVKNEKNSAGDRAAAVLKNFISPANIQKVDLSELDEQKLKDYEEDIKNGVDPNEAAYRFPKKQSKKEFTVGDQEVKMSNKDVSTYNQAKTTGGSEGARWVLESVMFNRPTTDANGNKILSDDAYTPEQKAQIIKSFDGKSLREVEEWLYEQPQFRNASPAEQRRVIKGLWNLTGQGKSVGARRVGEQAVVEAQGGDVDEYNFNNELSEKKRAALLPYIESGVLTYAECVDFERNAGKTYYYENDEGGSSQTYYNKKQMIEYLVKQGYSYEKAEALFNAFKAANAKPYSGNNLSSGRGRRRYGGRRYYRRRGRRGSSKKAKVPTPKKMGKLEAGTALTSGKSKSGSSSKKATPPTLKRVEAKIDLPTVRK